MQPSTPSRTALVTSLMRALHARADPHRILDDPWGDRLLPGVVRAGVLRRASAAIDGGPRAATEAEQDALMAKWLRGRSVYAGVITRSRYAEDALHAAVARGITQYVLLGAGFDSYALRVPPEAAHISVYEVDHPATQGFKRQRLRECAVTPAAPLHFLAADLAVEDLHTVLAASSFDFGQPAFFSWLGVTMYLTREANLAALRAIASAATPGSELVFSYVDQTAFDTVAIRDSELGKMVAAAGEPFISGFDPHTLAQDLHELGFALVEDLDDVQLVERYDPQDLNGLKPARHGHVAHARKSG